MSHQKEAEKVTNKPPIKKIGAWTILSFIFSSPVVVSAINVKDRIVAVETKVQKIEETQKKFETKIDDIHWFLIKRNKIEVPAK